MTIRYAIIRDNEPTGYTTKKAAVESLEYGRNFLARLKPGDVMKTRRGIVVGVRMKGGRSCKLFLMKGGRFVEAYSRAIDVVRERGGNYDYFTTLIRYGKRHFRWKGYDVYVLRFNKEKFNMKFNIKDYDKGHKIKP